VFLAGTAGYGLLVVALLNGVFLFSLSRPVACRRSACGGCVHQRRCGLDLQPSGEYWWSVGGLVAGAAVFAC
jgi:hypothetical protein